MRSTWSLARTSAAWDGQYTWTLTWNAVPGAAGYEVHLGEPGGPWAKPINVPGTTFSGKWSATSTPLCAEVRAYNAGGQSAYSGALCLPDRVPPPPSGVTAVVVGQCPSSPSLPYVTVSWTDTSDIEEYFVIRVRNPDWTPGVNRLGAYFSSPQTICGGLTPACYSVLAKNGAGDSELSNEVCLAP